MIAKLIVTNQVTPPKSTSEAPTRSGATEAVRHKLAELGITEADIADAVAWARRAFDQSGG